MYIISPQPISLSFWMKWSSVIFHSITASFLHRFRVPNFIIVNSHLVYLSQFILLFQASHVYVGDTVTCPKEPREGIFEFA